MSKERKPSRLSILLVALWVIFTVTLTAWWLIFGLRQLDLLNQSNLEAAGQLHRHYQMLLWEGGILIASLIGGGLALFYFARRGQKRHEEVVAGIGCSSDSNCGGTMTGKSKKPV